jgi:hypothetical protein
VNGRLDRQPEPTDPKPQVGPEARLLVCVGCGRPLGGDPEDDPVGESGMPLCGECNRARNFDALGLELGWPE